VSCKIQNSNLFVLAITNNRHVKTFIGSHERRCICAPSVPIDFTRRSLFFDQEVFVLHVMVLEIQVKKEHISMVWSFILSSEKGAHFNGLVFYIVK
ncbi:MAG: hypothetical protein ACKPKO_18970, partial [Candidatus Fonsibacter sp.]